MKRKREVSKEGKLGVEGMTPDVILSCLRRAGATFDEASNTVLPAITKQHLAALGLSGGANSSAKRNQLLNKLDFPEHMSCNAMLQALNLLLTPEELASILETIDD